MKITMKQLDKMNDFLKELNYNLSEFTTLEAIELLKHIDKAAQAKINEIEDKKETE